MSSATSVTPAPDWRLAAVLVALVAIAMATSYAAELGMRHEHVTAAARAIVQLAVVSLLITAALASLWWSLAAVLVMYAVATGTSGRRIGVPSGQVPWVGVALAAGALPVVALCVCSGVIPLSGPGIVPVAGIVVGGALLGGGTPTEAAAAQVLVLFALMAGQAITTGVLLQLIGRGRVVRKDLTEMFPR